MGEEFKIPDNTSKVIKKIKQPKAEDKEISIEKQLKKKTLSLEDRLSLIYAEVEKVLGHTKQNILVIKDKATLIDYAIRFSFILYKALLS